MHGIPMARPLLGQAEEEAVQRVLRSGWVMQGPEVAAFEAELAAWVGAANACAVSSGTAALHLALLALGVGAGDEVVTVSHSHIATANSVRLCGAVPVFVDIDPDTYNASARAIAATITNKTRAILCVHQMGMPCEIVEIAALARARGIAVIEDAACAAGSEVKVGDEWQKLGRPHGDLACFSFHPRKLITTGDGGMVTAKDAAVLERVRMLRQHGILDIEKPVETVGLNYRLSDVQAAIGREQLKRLAGLVRERQLLGAEYAAALGGHGLGLPAQPQWARTNWQTFCVRLPRGASQTDVRARLAQEGISTRTGIMNAHEQPAYTRTPSAWRQSTPLAASEAAFRECVTLPMFPGMTVEDVRHVSAALIRATRSG